MSDVNKPDGKLSAPVTLPSVSDFYLKQPLYQPAKGLKKKELRHYFELMHFTGTLDCYCGSCKSDSVFQSVLPVGERDALTKANALFRSMEAASFFVSVGKSAPPTDPFNAYFFASGLKFRMFQCSRNDTHILQFIFQVTADSVEKIGQYPSFADLTLSGESRYRKVLGEHFPELRQAVRLHSHSIGIGSFVYLRRIFEALIADAHAHEIAQSKWTKAKNVAYEKGRISGRIKLLRKTLPPFLVQNAGMYGILSEGVHNLNEEQCLKYFNTVLSGIELILEQKIAAEEMAARAAESSRAVTALKKSLEDVTGKT